jgi:uncharacterized membrane protein YgaE (UPF0421/DUF939 family)
VIAADPGLGHLQAGWRTLISMVVSLAVGYGMAHAVGVPSMLGLMVGGMLGMMTSFAVAENTPLLLARSILWMPIPYGAALALGSWMSEHEWRLAELVCISAALALTFFLVRFGPLGLLAGMMLFNGLMVNTIAPMPLDDCGWLFLIGAVTAIAILAARLVLCYPMPREDLLRTQRAFVIEARRVVDSAATALDPDAHQTVAIKRMGRALRRLNVTTLTIDGRLAMPELAADPVAAELLHQYLFDAELSLSGIGRAIQDMTGRHIPSELRETMVVGLVLARDTHLGRAGALHPAAEMIRRQADNASEGISEEEQQVRALARRVADLLDSLADSLAYWLDLGWSTPKSGAKVPFQPTVALERGMLPGSGPATQKLVAEKGGTGWRRLVPALRAPLQLAIGAAIVVPCADAINGHRYYWGLIGLMIVSFGTNTTHERVRKFAHRMVGTVIGAVIGILLAHLLTRVGGEAHVYWMLAVMVAGLTFGAWGMQRQYAYWVIGLVAALCQMYATETPLDQMDWLLTERLFENGLGFLVGIIVCALVFPVTTRKVAREAQRGYLSAVETLLRQLAQRWKDPEAPIRLRGAARGVDAALYQVQSVARPLVRMPMGVRGRRNDNLLALLGTATRHANALAGSADIDLDLAPAVRERMEHITEVFSGSLRALDAYIATGQRGGTWTRIGPMVTDLEVVLRAPADPRAGRLTRALRELAALDEVLAAFADTRGMRTTTVQATAETPRLAPTLAPRDAEPVPRTIRMAANAPVAPQAQPRPQAQPQAQPEPQDAPGAVPGRAPAADAPSGRGAVRLGAAASPTAHQLRAVHNAWARSGGASEQAARAALSATGRASQAAAPAASAPATPAVGSSPTAAARAATARAVADAAGGAAARSGAGAASAALPRQRRGGGGGGSGAAAAAGPACTGRSAAPSTPAAATRR